MNHKPFTVGSRESALAVVQSNMVLDYLKEHNPGREFGLVTMKTTGDIILDRRLDQIGGKGLFVKELDIALREGRSDLSVHSSKDLPMDIPQDLPLICFSKREDPRDVLILPRDCTELDVAKPIGTSSKRRILQLQKLYPNARFESVRGNLQTRLRKLDEGQYSALILAAAGVKRMGLAHRISHYYNVEDIIPSAGQGILALQGRQGTDYSCLDGFGDEDAKRAILAERAFVRQLDGGCTSPIAAHALIQGESIRLLGFYYEESTGSYIKKELTSAAASPEACEALGIALAKQILQEAAK